MREVNLKNGMVSQENAYLPKVIIAILTFNLSGLPFSAHLKSVLMR